MSAEPPRQLSLNEDSPHYDRKSLGSGVEVFFNGIRMVNCVIEYDVDAGTLTRYVTTALGRKVTDRFHQPLTKSHKGVVRPMWRAEWLALGKPSTI